MSITVTTTGITATQSTGGSTLLTAIGATDDSNIGTSIANASALLIPKTRFTGFGRVSAGTANARIVCVGDSTTIGAFSTGSATGNLKPLSWPSQLSGMLTTSGMNSNWNGFLGDSSIASPTTAQDTRIVLGSGWTRFGVDDASTTIGGGFFTASAATSSLAFTPTTQTDSCIVYYAKGSGASGGTINTNANGGANTATNTGTGGSALGSIIIMGTLGANTYNVNWASGNPVYIIGFEAYDSSKTSVNVLNAGWNASTSGNWTLATQPYYTLPPVSGILPTLTIIMLGINDWRTSVSIATFTANIQAIITQGLLGGDVVLCSPVPSNPGFSSAPSLAVQQTYVNALSALAISNNILFIDIFSRWVSYASANSWGAYGDGLHPNGTGYFDIATAIYNGITV